MAYLNFLLMKPETRNPPWLNGTLKAQWSHPGGTFETALFTIEPPRNYTVYGE